MSRPRLASSHETFTVPGLTSSAASETAGCGVAKREKQGWLNILKVGSILIQFLLGSYYFTEPRVQ